MDARREMGGCRIGLLVYQARRANAPRGGWGEGVVTADTLRSVDTAPARDSTARTEAATTSIGHRARDIAHTRTPSPAGAVPDAQLESSPGLPRHRLRPSVYSPAGLRPGARQVGA